MHRPAAGISPVSHPGIRPGPLMCASTGLVVGNVCSRWLPLAGRYGRTPELARGLKLDADVTVRLVAPLLRARLRKLMVVELACFLTSHPRALFHLAGQLPVHQARSCKQGGKCLKSPRAGWRLASPAPRRLHYNSRYTERSTKRGSVIISFWQRRAHPASILTPRH